MGIADLERRTVTALVYGVVVLAALFAPYPTFAVLVAVLAVLGYVELRALFRYRSYQPWLVGVVFVAGLRRGARGRATRTVARDVVVRPRPDGVRHRRDRRLPR